MSVNIFGGRPNACIATTTQTFASMGLDVTNTYVIYEVGVTLKSWMPDRLINAIVGQTAGNGYYFVARIDMDLTAYLVPPTSSLPPLIDILLTATLQQVLDNNNVSTTPLKIQVAAIFAMLSHLALTFDDSVGNTTIYGQDAISMSFADGSAVLLNQLGCVILDVDSNPIVGMFNEFGTPTWFIQDTAGNVASITAEAMTAATGFTIPGWRGGQLALAGDGAAPVLTAGTSAGTSPTIGFAANADDVAGTISVHTGTSPAVSNKIVRVAFHKAYPVTPTVILTPGNGLAAALSGNANVYAFNVTTTWFEIFVGSTALAASSTYIWNYHVDN